jgi:hypothetical protein
MFVQKSAPQLPLAWPAGGHASRTAPHPHLLATTAKFAVMTRYACNADQQAVMLQELPHGNDPASTQQHTHQA